MNQRWFDDFVQVVGREATRRTVLGTALAAGLLAGQGDGGAGKRTNKQRHRARKQRRKQAKSDQANDPCFTLCSVLPKEERESCRAAAAANLDLCNCPSFCEALYPDQIPQQLGCLAEAADSPQSNFCLACGTDPDRACALGDWFVCRPADGCCQDSDCESDTCNTNDYTCGPSGG